MIWNPDRSGRRPGTGDTLRHGLAIVGLLAATLIAFVPLFENEFINYDDPFTLQHNGQLSAPGVLTWAFTTTHMGHYQPLAWLAWFQVKALFGLNAVAFHGVSLLGHLANALLIYLLSIRLTALAGFDLRSQRLAALVASMAFAVHPIRVEVVAWASAFPYILSLMCLLLALLAYVSSCTTTGTAARRRWLGVSVACYVFSLLSRVVGLGFPFVLLALDIYPIRRFVRINGPDPKPKRQPGPRNCRGLLVEKIPFFAAAVVAALVESSSRELTGMQEVGFGARLTMAITAPFVYLGRTLLPIGRSPLEARPIQPQLEWMPLLMGLAGLIVISIAAWRRRHRWPVLPVGWLSFLLLLAPVIGLTPSGQQAIADRYLYFPGVVLSLLAGGFVAGIASETGLFPIRVGPHPHALTPLRPPSASSVDSRPRAVSDKGLRVTSLVVMIILASVLGAATWRQTRWWHDSITLWTRAADLDPRNDIATYNLAIALSEAGREEEAAGRYEQTLRLVHDHEPARRNLTLIHVKHAERQGDEFTAAGRFDEAIERYARVLELDANNETARASRGIALMRRGRFREAVDDLRPALGVRPDDLALVNALAFALMQTARSGEAASLLKQTLARHPEDDEVAHNLARVLATAPDPNVRDGALALRLALAVRDRTGGRDPRVLDTLSAAYAATGQLLLARTTSAEAARLARQLGQSDLAEEISAHARGYRP